MPTTIERLDSVEQELRDAQRRLQELRECHARRKAEGKRVGGVRITQLDRLERELARLLRIAELQREYGDA